MLPWLLAIIFAYLFFSLSSFGDKVILSQKIKPKLYTFYIGISSILVVLALPFIGFALPPAGAWVWVILEAFAFMLAIYSMFSALEKFDVSRVMPAIGGLQPIFILLMTVSFWGAKALAGMDLLAFLLLLSGSIIISFEKRLAITRHYLMLVVFSALMFSADYLFSKMVFGAMPFLRGLVWMNLARFCIAAPFLLGGQFRRQVFTKQPSINPKTGAMFFFTQGAGAIGYFLQGLAISLAPVSQLALVNSLRGLQYVFLFLITLGTSFFIPGLLKENISKKTLLQKGVSLGLIALGLAVLALY